MTKPKLQFKAGDRVIKGGPKEVGVIVHSWFSDEIGGMEDCSVAFFGKKFPSGKPSQIPYVLRYAATSLKRAPGVKA